MINKVYLIGAGGLAREVEELCYRDPDYGKKYLLEGFLVTEKNLFSDKENLKKFPTKLKLVGSYENFKFQKDDEVILAIGDVNFKQKISILLKDKVKFKTVISPRASVSPNALIGEGSIICDNTFISTNVNVANFVLVNVGSQIGHDSSIGTYTSLMAQVEIGGACSIGDRVLIGSNATIIPLRKVGNDCLIGAGSVLINNLKGDSKVFGNPAKKILI